MKLSVFLQRLAYVAECLRFVAPMSKIVPPSFSLKRELCEKRKKLRYAERCGKGKFSGYNRRGVRHK